MTLTVQVQDKSPATPARNGLPTNADLQWPPEPLFSVAGLVPWWYPSERLFLTLSLLPSRWELMSSPAHDLELTKHVDEG
jgi:hypothetical protein